jgi:hypothetical protein
MAAVSRLVKLSALAVLALASSGCLIFSSFGICTTGTGTGGAPIGICTFTMNAHLAQCVDSTNLVVGSNGCLPAWLPNCGSGTGSATTGYPCTFAPGSTISVKYWEDDPLFVEMPSSWHARGVSTWKNLATADSGLVIVIPGDALSPLGGGGPIVLDPGYSSWLVYMDRPASGDIQYSITFVHPLSDTACVKGMEVGALYVSGYPAGILPATLGQTFDFTQLPAVAPNAICVGPLTTTPTRRGSWGELKMRYR